MENIADIDRTQINQEVMVAEVIHAIGIPAHIRGYYYLREAIMISMNDITILSAITKILYPTIAKKYATTPSRVERAIRHAVKLAWERGNRDVLIAYFGYTIQNGQDKPTNSEFIAMISDRLRLQLNTL